MKMKDFNELEAEMFNTVRVYYERDKPALHSQLSYVERLPRYRSFCMNCRWWKRFLIDAKTFLTEDT